MMSLWSIISLAGALTISQLVQNDPTLSQAASLIQNNPSWSQSGKITVIAPTNSAIQSSPAGVLENGSLGAFTTRLYIDPNTPFMLAKDDVTEARIVFQNDNPNGAAVISVRFGLGNGRLRAVTADNGVLYVSDVAIGLPQKITKTLQAIGCLQFANIISTLGMTGFIDGLVGVTMFAPTDAAYLKSKPILDGLTQNQMISYVLYHVQIGTVYSNNLASGDFQTLLGNNTIPITASSQGALIGPQATSYVFSQPDNYVSSGVIQRIDYFMTPPSLPLANQVVSPSNVPAGSTGVFLQRPATPTITTYGQPTRSAALKGKVVQEAVIGGFAALLAVLL